MEGLVCSAHRSLAVLGTAVSQPTSPALPEPRQAASPCLQEATAQSPALWAELLIRDLPISHTLFHTGESARIILEKEGAGVSGLCPYSPAQSSSKASPSVCLIYQHFPWQMWHLTWSTQKSNHLIQFNCSLLIMTAVVWFPYSFATHTQIFFWCGTTHILVHN